MFKATKKQLLTAIILWLIVLVCTPVLADPGGSNLILVVQNGGTTIGTFTKYLVLNFSSGCSVTGSTVSCTTGGVSNSAGNNVVTKSNGTNLVASSCIDDGSTLTCTVPFVVSGSTAGFLDMPQGSSNGTGTTSVRLQSPAAVTSYVLNFPAAGPTNNLSALAFSNASPSVGSFVKLPETTMTSGSAYTNATTTFSNVVGSTGQTLQFSVEASTNYLVQCEILWQGSAATTGPKFQFTGPASPTAVSASLFSPVTTTTFIEATATGFSSPMADTGTITTATNFVAKVTLGLVNGSNAGTVVLQAAANGVGTLTIQPASSCVKHPV